MLITHQTLSQTTAAVITAVVRGVLVCDQASGSLLTSSLFW
jgi:hypothetical protein